MVKTKATSKTNIDLLIEASWILPIIPRQQLLKDCAIAVHNGEIIALLPKAEAKKRFIADTHHQLDHHVLMPGLINSHGHAAMSLLRGYADDKPLMDWLENHIWPAEKQWVNHQFVKDGTELAMAEMIRSGTTCFADMYFFPEAAALAAQQAGMRAQITFPILDFPTNWGRDAEEYLSKGIEVHDRFRSQDLIRVGFGPHAPYTISNKPLERIAVLAEELQAPIQIHLHETAFEIEQALQQGQRPSQRLFDLGIMSPLTQCVHMTQVNDHDIQLLQTSGAHVIHCPKSNVKLTSGFNPSHQLLEAGVNVALGTDGAASNNGLDMFAEMNIASLLAKTVSDHASALDATTSLEMATINGARAMGIDHKVGSLEVGKQADMIAVSMDQLEQLPLYNIPSQLVYTACGPRVSHNWVNGRALMLERQLQTLAEHELSTKAKQWAERINTQ